MRNYIIPLLLYILVPFITEQITTNVFVIYLIKTIIVLGSLIYFFKSYKLNFKLDILAIIVGLVIAGLWVLVELWYPMISKGDRNFDPFLTSIPYWIIGLRFFGSVLVAPFVEELFSRDFLPRFIDFKDWKSVKSGNFTIFSFIVVILFFVLVHEEKVAALITAVILNVLLIKRKNITSCIQAHAAANLFLGAYIVITQSWFFW